MPKLEFVALSNSQVEIMERLWRSTRRTSIERLRQEHTVDTFETDLAVLVENKFISVDRVRGQEMVTSLISEESGLKAMVKRVKQLAQAATKGSVLQLVQAITSRQTLSKKMQDEVDKIIDKMD